LNILICRNLSIYSYIDKNIPGAETATAYFMESAFLFDCGIFNAGSLELLGKLLHNLITTGCDSTGSHAHIDNYFAVHGLSLVFFETLDNFTWSYLPKHLFINQNNRGDTAGAHTVDTLKGKLHILGCNLIIFQFKIFANFGDDAGCTFDVTNCSTANSDNIFTARMLMELGKR
jgi:hypothetical protein